MILVSLKSNIFTSERLSLPGNAILVTIQMQFDDVTLKSQEHFPW